MPEFRRKKGEWGRTFPTSTQKATLGPAKNKRKDSTEQRINWRRWIFPSGNLYQASFYHHLFFFLIPRIQNFVLFCFLNLRMALPASISKAFVVFKDSGALDASESWLILFSGIYYPSVYIGGVLEVKHCSCVGAGNKAVCWVSC